MVTASADRASSLSPVSTRSAPFSLSALQAMNSRYATPSHFSVWNASALACSSAATPSTAAAMCGTMPSVQPKAATTLARAPRDRPAASV